MKSDGQLRTESNSRTIRRVSFGIVSGIVTAIFLNWKWLLLLIAAFCLFESIALFKLVKRTQLLRAQLENEGKILSPEERGRIIGHSHGYALSFAVVQYFLSF